ncbi:ABC transporter ATP-binding protein [Paraglaciecola sp. MB-3u-78]|jgi:ABC-2 type transport system ATP-binding protein|uniref:ABC transporter ATP-binding protein n=1 Tax=Paraglaciecola sp. MB-3u-78 TaxID=2058332 RepID=UPI000C325D9C|nr:ABC transporter ATP-binding protein [Paraglaciecola sp. MB-3u-78]PKG98576.1 ABC transporter ATP-binding protein [Paraglaciecola sp. MB-3u-78]
MQLEHTYEPHIHPHVIASVYGLSKSFAGKKALDNIDLEIKSGQVFAILGANGAGKTTLINILLGRLNADSGDVSVFGVKAGSLQAKRQAGAMLQVANLPETLKIKEHIQLFQSYYPHPMDYQKVINYAGLQDMQNRYSKKLSGGEKQRLLFALSICGNPKLLFLDEPSVGMDVAARQGLWQAIRDLRAKGTGIVLTTHYLEEADNLADEIVLLKQGRIIRKGSSDAIKASISHTTIRFSRTENHHVFKPLPAVVNVQLVGKFIQIHTENVNQTLLALLSAYPNIQELTVSSAGLEEAFLHLNAEGK